MNLIARLGDKLSRRFLPSGFFPASQLMSLGRGIGLPSAAGVEVTEATALTCATHYACIQAPAQDIAKVPMFVIRRGDDWTETRIRHPIQKVLDYPNPDMNRNTFWACMAGCMYGWGQSFAEIIRDGLGRPAQLVPIQPWRVQPMYDADGTLYYYVSGGYTYPGGPIGNSVVLRKESVLHLKNGFTPDGILGLPVVALAREVIGSYLATQTYLAGWYGNNAMPSGVLMNDRPMDPKAMKETLEGWNRDHGGLRNSNKVGILGNGTKFQAISSDPEKSQLTESKYQMIEEICRLHRVPPHKVGHLLRSSFSTVEEQNIQYAQDKLAATFSQIEWEIKAKLLVDEEDVFVDFDETELFRGNIMATYDALNKGVLGGYVLPNEARRKIGLNPTANGDQLLVPLNTIAASALETVPASEIKMQLLDKQVAKNAALAAAAPKPAEVPASIIPAEGSPEKGDDTRSADLKQLAASVSPMLTDAVIRLLQVESDKVIRSAKKEGFPGWVETFYGDHGTEVRTRLASPLRALANISWAVQGLQPDAATRQRVEDSITEIASRHVAASKGDLGEVDGLAERVGGWVEHRSASFVEAELDGFVELLK